MSNDVAVKRDQKVFLTPDRHHSEAALVAIRAALGDEPPAILTLFSSQLEDGERTEKKILSLRRGPRDAEDLVVEINDDGQVTFGEGYTPDAAAREFWSALASLPVVREYIKRWDEA